MPVMGAVSTRPEMHTSPIMKGEYATVSMPIVAPRRTSPGISPAVKSSGSLRSIADGPHSGEWREIADPGDQRPHIGFRRTSGNLIETCGYGPALIIGVAHAARLRFGGINLAQRFLERTPVINDAQVPLLPQRDHCR